VIDIQEPQRAEYTPADKAELKEEFLVLLHTLLLVYLALHNLLIPLMANFLRGNALLTDVHFWFFLHFPLQWYLRRRESPPLGYVQFLILGTVTRLVFELYLASNLKSWHVLSVIVSEVSAGIFYFLYYPSLRSRKLMWSCLLGLFIPPALALIELRPEVRPLVMPLARQKLAGADLDLGCKGSQLSLNYPLSARSPVIQKARITDCGFTHPLAAIGPDFAIHNTSGQQLNLRLYRLQVLHGKVRWKFMRLVQVGDGDIWDVGSLLKDHALYVIKSPERRKLGALYLLPEHKLDFPLGKGQLNLGYDFLEWRNDEPRN
jgi:hypothetical protein